MRIGLVNYTTISIYQIKLICMSINTKNHVLHCAVIWVQAKIMNLDIQLFRNGKAPSYGTPQSAGMDLYAAIDNDVTIIKPGKYELVPCGFAMALPDGYEAQIRPRSGLALKHGITVLNTPGTIDADYRGEVCVILVNMGSEDFVVTSHMRIAQMIIATYEKVVCSVVDSLNKTERGQQGFGSTGVH